MSWSDFDGTCTELSVNKIVRNDDYFSVRDEWMNQLLSNPILVPWIFGMNSDGNITQHGFNTSRSDLNFLCWIVFLLVCKMNNNTKLNFFIVSRDFQQGSAIDVLIIDIDIRDGSFQSCGPVD
jgi:hypothetical protein